MTKNLYAKFTVLLAMSFCSLNLAAHQIGEEGQNGLYAFMHNLTHAIAFQNIQLSTGFLYAMVLLLSILAFIAYKVKHSE